MDQNRLHDPVHGDESPVGLMSIDPSGRILETNPALLRFLGSPSREATAQINVLTYLPLVQAGLAADFRRALTEGQVVSSERDYTSKWGKTIHARVTALPVVDAAGTVVRAQVLVEDRTASHRAEGLLRIQRNLGVALASASTLSGALEAILDAVLSIEGIDCGGVYLVDDGDLVLKVHRHLSPDFVERTERFGPDDPHTRLVMAAGPVFRRWTDLVLPADPIVDGEGLRATAVIPVVHEGKVIGSLNAASHDEDEIQDPARDALQAISSQIGIVTSRLRAEDDLRERERFLALLSEITRRTLEAGDVNEWLGTLTDEVAALFGCDACFVTGWNETSQQMVPLAASSHRTENYRAVTPLPGERTITQTALEMGLPIVVEEIRSSSAISPRLAQILPGWSALGLPLLARGQRLGAIVLAWDAPHRSTAREVAAGEQAAAQISLALSHAGFSSLPRRRAATDPLTGLLGHRELIEIGEREVRRALRLARPFHAVLLQLDQLPVVRSHHGANAVDEILREVAGRVRASVRTVDVLGLVNDEVFFVLLAESAPKEPVRVAERLRSAVAGRPFAAKHGELSLSASAGVSGVSEEIRDFPALLSGAEKALAAARAAGGNRTVVHQ